MVPGDGEGAGMGPPEEGLGMRGGIGRGGIGYVPNIRKQGYSSTELQSVGIFQYKIFSQ